MKNVYDEIELLGEKARSGEIGKIELIRKVTDLTYVEVCEEKGITNETIQLLSKPVLFTWYSMKYIGGFIEGFIGSK